MDSKRGPQTKTGQLPLVKVRTGHRFHFAGEDKIRRYSFTKLSRDVILSQGAGLSSYMNTFKGKGDV